VAEEPAPAGPAPTAMRHEPMGMPARTDIVLMATAVLGVSTSAPLIAATAAPALAIAFWRNALAVAVTGPAVLLRFRPELGSLRRREWLLSALAGVFLAGHFATWVPSVKLTTVASATALVCTQPIWAAVLASLAGRRVARGAWVAIAIGVLGAVLVTGADVSISSRAVTGDVLALAGGVFAAAYVTAGGASRRSVSTTVYTTVAYSVCALVLLLMCVIGGQRLIGYDGDTWARLVALTVAAQLIGHSLINRVLATTSATVASLALLLEVPGAAILAAIFLHQRPPASALPGLGLVLVGLGLTVRSGTR